MAETLQKNREEKSPFSPLQTGCAFVMLTNMLIYLGVVVFTFNLLDPSNLDANYLAKRGFTARPDPERSDDKAFRQLSEEKRKDQEATQAEIMDTAKLGLKKEPSPAIKLSELQQRNLGVSRPEEPESPKAALTESPVSSGSTIIRAAQSRLYSSPAIYPQATLPQTYSLQLLSAPKITALETYTTIPVEMASGVDFPMFSMPSFNPLGSYLYRPPNPAPDAARGGLKLNSPPVGADSLYTNGLRKAKNPKPVKDKL
jgi:hypothetical protein